MAICPIAEDMSSNNKRSSWLVRAVGTGGACRYRVHLSNAKDVQMRAHCLAVNLAHDEKKKRVRWAAWKIGKACMVGEYCRHLYTAPDLAAQHELCASVTQRPPAVSGTFDR